jgi:hypothetical protein
MRNLFVGTLIVSIGCAVVQGQTPKAGTPNKLEPLNVKIGLWENTTTISSSGAVGIPPERLAKMSPEQRASGSSAQGAGRTTRAH